MFIREALGCKKLMVEKLEVNGMEKLKFENEAVGWYLVGCLSAPLFFVFFFLAGRLFERPPFSCFSFFFFGWYVGVGCLSISLNISCDHIFLRMKPLLGGRLFERPAFLFFLFFFLF